MDFAILKFSPTLHFPIGTLNGSVNLGRLEGHREVLWTFTFDELGRISFPFRFVIHLLSSFFHRDFPPTLQNFTFHNFSLPIRTHCDPSNLLRLTLP